MKLRVNLVVTLLTLSCATHALETSTQLTRQDEPRGYRSTSLRPRNRFDSGVTIIVADDPKKVLRTTTKRRPLKTYDNSYNSGLPANVKSDKPPNRATDALKIAIENRQGPRKKRHKMDRTLTALLLAYKLKFLALIPTLVGGFLLLKFTALLAGFFFALFAAVLGLKID